jgi:LysM repeat protein
VRRHHVRLTQRGRVVLGFLALLLAGLGVLAAAPASQAAGAGATGPAPSVVVRPGDTLWSIATRAAPHDDPFRTIEEIRQINGLSGYTVPAGLRLTLPRRR